MPEARVDEIVAALAEIGFPLDVNRVRAASIACTGEPHCNFSVTETKPRLDSLVQHARGSASATTSPGSGSTWTAARTPARSTGSATSASRARRCATTQGKRRQAYDVFLRGGLGPQAAIARPVFRRVPTEELDETVERLVAGWLAARADGETFRAFCDRTSDERAGRPGRAASRRRDERRRRRA